MPWSWGGWDWLDSDEIPLMQCHHCGARASFRKHVADSVLRTAINAIRCCTLARRRGVPSYGTRMVSLVNSGFKHHRSM